MRFWAWDSLTAQSTTSNQESRMAHALVGFIWRKGWRFIRTELKPVSWRSRKCLA